MAASRATHAAVYINDKYYGLYISVEHIDDEFLQNRFEDASGNLWKCLWPADLAYRGENPGNYFPFYEETRPYQLKTNLDEYDYSQLARLIKIINAKPDFLFPDSLETILAVPEVLKYFAVNNLVGGWDDYCFLKNNYYLYYEPAQDIFHWIPYDYDNTFGVDWFDINWSIINPYTFDKIDGGDRPLVDRIMQVPEYKNLYSHFLEFYLEKFFEINRFESKLFSIKDKITPFVEADTFRTLDYGFTIEDFHNSYSSSYSNQHIKTGIRKFVTNKIILLSSQIQWLETKPMIYDINYWPKSPAPDDTIFVEAAIFSKHDLADVSIQFHPGTLTVLFEYQMEFKPKSEIKFIEDKDCWIGKIPPLGENAFGHFQIKASNILNKTQIAPKTKSIKIQTENIIFDQVVINEVLAKNDSINSDESGDFDDWIEIYNFTDSEVNLSGKYLTDNSNNPAKWKFPETDIKLNSKEYLLVWCDGDSEQAVLHTNFRLNAGTEFIGLIAEDGITFIDSLSFGQQTADISFGRLADGENNWQFLKPTPGYSNSKTTVKNHSVPNDFKIDIFPNPFKQFTYIKINGQNRREYSIKIYDLLGRLVWQKFPNDLPSGQIDLQWNGVNKSGNPISAGIYLVKVISGSFSEERKIVLLK